MILKRHRERLFLVLIFLSGASALIYEILWTRMLTLVFGVTLLAVSAVLAAFMTGLAVGSFVFGWVIDRTPRSPLLVYALLEIGIGLSAMVLPFMISHLKEVEVALSHRGAPLFFATWVRFVLCFAILTVPTTLMGGTFPVMCAAFRHQAAHVGRTVGRLYAVNTLGAVGGAFFAGFVLLEYVGVRATNSLAVVLNALVAIGMVLLAPVFSGVPRLRTPPPSPLPSGGRKGDRSPLLLAAVFWIGCAALSYEVLWTRVLIVYLESTIYALTIIVITFLAWLAVGSLLCGRIVDRIKHPFMVFGVLQILVALTVMMGLPLLNRLPWLDALLEPLRQSWLQLLFIKFLMAFLIMLVPTFLSGALMPLAIRLSYQGSEGFGSQVGRVYGMNTMGAIVGSLLPSFLLIPTLGIKQSILLISATQAMTGALLLLFAPFSSLRWKVSLLGGTAVSLLLGLATLLPESYPNPTGQGAIRSTSATFSSSPLLFYKEGMAEIVSVYRDPGGKTLDINGFIEAQEGSGFPHGRMLGHLPMLLHPHPKTALVVGLGAGITAGAISLYDVDRIDIVEINPDVITAAGYFPEANHGVLRDQRMRVILNDARNYLLVTEQRYDVITADPLPPHFARSNNLFSREYYTLCRDRLTDQGIVIQWLPLSLVPDEGSRMILKTFSTVFPATLVWLQPDSQSVVLVGMRTRFAVNYDTASQRFLSEQIRKELEEGGLLHIEDVLSNFIMTSTMVAEYVGDSPLITDDRPYLEFLGPKVLTTPRAYGRLRGINIGHLTHRRHEVKPLFSTDGAHRYVNFD